MSDWVIIIISFYILQNSHILDYNIINVLAIFDSESDYKGNKKNILRKLIFFILGLSWKKYIKDNKI